MDNEHQVITISPIFPYNNSIIIRNNESNTENNNKCVRQIKKFNNLPLLIKVIIIGTIVGILGISGFVIYAISEFGKLSK